MTQDQQQMVTVPRALLEPFISEEAVYLTSLDDEAEEQAIWPTAGAIRALRAALSASPPAPEDMREREIEAAFERGKDEGATYVMQSLAELCGVEFTIRDGSETWDGDVHATMYGILEDARVVDPWDNSIAKHETLHEERAALSPVAVAGREEDDPCPNGEHCCCCGPGDTCCDCGEKLIDLERDVALSCWTDFLDDNPDDLTSQEDLPDHALVTFEQFYEMARDVLPRLTATPKAQPLGTTGDEALLPAEPGALASSIAYLDRHADDPLDDIENWQEYGESVLLVLHELKRLRAAGQDEALREALPDPVRMKEAIEDAVRMLRATDNWHDADLATEGRLLIAAQLEEAIDGTYAQIDESVTYDRDGPR